MVKDYTFYTPILNKVCNYLFGQKIINYFYVSHQLLINTFNITSKTILYVKIHVKFVIKYNTWPTKIIFGSYEVIQPIFLL